MARIRTIKPEFWKNEALSSLPESTHLLAAALLNYADDEGYFNANAGLVRAECSPLREPGTSIEKSLALLEGVGYLAFGTAADGRRFGLIVNFAKHQKVSHPTPSRVKGLVAFPNYSGVLPNDSALIGTGNREQGKEGKGFSCGTPEAGEPPQPAETGSQFSFAIAGKEHAEWVLPQRKLDEYRESFPDLDVAAELRAARQWCRDNRANRKTASGMPRFLGNWLKKAQNNPQMRAGPKPNTRNGKYAPVEVPEDL